MLLIARTLTSRCMRYHFAREKVDIVRMSKEIFDTKSTSEFFKLFAAKRGMFELDCMTHGMRRLTGLMKDNGFQNNFREYQDSVFFLEHIGTLPPESMNIKQMSGFIGLFHKFERKGINPSAEALRVKRKILQQIQNRVNATKYQAVEDIDSLLVTYLQIQNESFNAPSLAVAQAIYKLLKLLSSNFKSPITLTHHQAFTFMRAASSKQEFNRIEQELITIVLNKIKEEIETVEPNLLLLIALDMSAIDECSLTPDNMASYQTICEKLYNLVPEMSQKQIKMLLNYPNSLNNNGLTDLRIQIMQSLFSMIDLQGNCSLGSQQMTDLLIAGSTKLSLSQFSQLQQDNFFNFLLKFGPQKQKSRSGYLTLILSTFIDYNFFSLSHQPKLNQILEVCHCKITIQILFRMAIRGFQVGKLIKKEDFVDFDNTKGKNIVKMAIILKRAQGEIEPSQDIVKLKAQFDQLIFNQIDTFEKASQFYFKLSRQEDFLQMICHMHAAIPQLIQCLPNYFESNEEKNYKVAQKCHYFEYILQNFGNQSPQTDMFVEKYKDKLYDGVLKRMLQKQICKSNQKIEVQKQLLLLIHHKFNHFIAQKNHKIINLTASLLLKYLNPVIHKKVNKKTEQAYWKMVNLMHKSQKLIFSFVKQKRNLDSLFYALLSKTHYHKCKDNESYMQLIKKLRSKKNEFFRNEKDSAENIYNSKSISKPLNSTQQITSEKASKPLTKNGKQPSPPVRRFFSPKIPSQ